MLFRSTHPRRRRAVGPPGTGRSFAALGWLILSIGVLSGCATYHQQNIQFHTAIAEGRYQDAVDFLETHDRDADGKNRLLYRMEKGSALHLAGHYLESNTTLEEAYVILEEFQRNYALEALSFITNPAIVPYPGEDFEKVQIHYYKALNFTLLGNISDALVEARRINIKLNQLNDRYEAGRKNHYGSDAFAWTLMGLLFDASREYNDAFICYRNALDTYESSYSADYGLGPPDRLILDLMTAAWRTGLTSELEQYKARYSVGWSPPASRTGGSDIVIFWNNGLGPVKTEDSVNFTLDRGDVGFITFVSEDRNFFLPVPVGGKDTNSLRDISLIRMALPRYLERPPLYCRATAVCNETPYPLEKAQDINDIAFLNLHDRMGRELGTALLRLAIKQGIERAVRKQDAALGVVVSIVNAATEKADTRNWQTLPHDIYYTRIPAAPGPCEITLERTTVSGTTDSVSVRVDVSPGRTAFLVFHDPDSLPR